MGERSGSTWRMVYKAVMGFLSKLNPLSSYLNYRRQRDLAIARERELERMERREELALLRSTVEQAFKVASAQTAAFQTFLSGFHPIGTPEVREWDDEEAERRYIQKRQARGTSLPRELAGLSSIEQFQLLIDKMEKD